MMLEALQTKAIKNAINLLKNKDETIKLLKEKIALYEAITTEYDHKRIDNLINIYENNQK